MTHQRILWAINDTAELAARSAFDAFGNDPAADLPTPEMAWDFLETLYADAEIARPAALPDRSATCILPPYGAASAPRCEIKPARG